MKKHSIWRKVSLVVAVAVLAFPVAAVAGEAKGTIKIATQSPLSGDPCESTYARYRRSPTPVTSAINIVMKP